MSMRRNRVQLICNNCKKTYEVIKSREKRSRFCSAHCHGKGVLAKLDQSTFNRARGERNHNWKGGRRKHTEGYMTILIDGAYILEHRHVMQQHLKRKLQRREHVHHLNGDKLDNRLENLEIISAKEHGKKHCHEGHVARWSK